MKTEFENWWDKNGTDYDYYTQKDAWKAALEWALNHNTTKQSRTFRQYLWFVEEELKGLK